MCFVLKLRIVQINRTPEMVISRFEITTYLNLRRKYRNFEIIIMLTTDWLMHKYLPFVTDSHNNGSVLVMVGKIRRNIRKYGRYGIRLIFRTESFPKTYRIFFRRENHFVAFNAIGDNDIINRLNLHIRSHISRPKTNGK